MSNDLVCVEKLSKLFPHCTKSSLLCSICKPDHQSVTLDSSSTCSHYEWCFCLSCPNFLSNWFICTQYLFQRHMKDKKQIQDHHRYHHSNTNNSKIKGKHPSNIPHLPFDTSLSDNKIYSNSSLSVLN